MNSYYRRYKNAAVKANINEEPKIPDKKYRINKPQLSEFGLEDVNMLQLYKEYDNYLAEKSKTNKIDNILKAIALLTVISSFYLMFFKHSGNIFLLISEIFAFILFSFIKNIYFNKERFFNLELINSLEEYEKAKEEHKWWQDYRNEERWRSMNGFEFEKEIEALFKRNGYNANLTKNGADGGIDIIMEKNKKKIAVQCKAYKGKVSESVVRDLYGVLHSYKFDSGFLVTLNGASKNAAEFCESKKDR
ncbi:MAG: restriction endonuclease, partial [Eubacteriaceae bacterium]|nr:restriction endonuclease [Eubacteriaceae bacterium]